MSVNLTVIERITIRDCSELQPEVIETVMNEVDRIKSFRNRRSFSCTLKVNDGRGWEEYTGRRFSHRSIGAAIRKNRKLSIFIRCGFSSYASDLCLPGFALETYFDTCEEKVLKNLSFEFFYQVDEGSSCGSIIQCGMGEDGSVYKKPAEYEEILEIPDTVWLNEPCTVSIFAEDLSKDYDPAAVNAAVRRLNTTEYYPKENLEDFHNADAEAIINQPKLETPAQRKEFFAALEEAWTATKGKLVFDEPEFVDAGTENVRMLKLDMDKDTGEVRYYMTKPICCAE